MIVVLAGPIHGRFQQLYNATAKVAKELQEPVSWILQTGDLGVWPDPTRIPRAVKRRGAEAQFASMYLKEQEVPVPTLFIAGIHEDHAFLNYRCSQGKMEILPRLHYLMPGFSTVIGDQEERLSIVGLGKSYSPCVYNGKSTKGLKAIRHYTRRDVERACSHGLIDVFLSYEAPLGKKLGENLISASEGIEKISFAVRPTLAAHRGAAGSEFLQYRNTNTDTLTLRLPPLSIFALRYEKGQLIPIE